MHLRLRSLCSPIQPCYLFYVLRWFRAFHVGHCNSYPGGRLSTGVMESLVPVNLACQTQHLVSVRLPSMLCRRNLLRLDKRTGGGLRPNNWYLLSTSCFKIIIGNMYRFVQVILNSKVIISYFEYQNIFFFSTLHLTTYVRSSNTRQRE